MCTSCTLCTYNPLMRNLADKRVLVTGGASGLGLAIARRFAAAGARLVLADIDANALEAAAAGLALDGGRVATCPMDVSAPESVAAARDRIHREGGPIDVLVNNAGVVFGGGFTDVALARHLDTYRVNLVGAVIVTHAFLPGLVARPEGHLVNMASASGLIALPYGSTYASSKWGLIGFSDSILQMWAAYLDERIRGPEAVPFGCGATVGVGRAHGAGGRLRLAPTHTTWPCGDAGAGKNH